MQTDQARLRYPADWIRRRENRQPISVLTAYDATMARLLARSPVDALLVGDTVGMVIQGHNSTLPVTLDEIIYHCRMVRRGAPELFLIGDMPFGSYQADASDGIRAAIRIMKETGADAVKFEGTHPDTLHCIRKLTAQGVPVMGHIGLTPQSYLNTSGFKLQGRSDDDQRRLLNDALALQDAGCFAMVIELCVARVAGEITEQLSIPTIGIGAGPHTSGQVQVSNDLLGLDPDFRARHARQFASLAQPIVDAAGAYHQAVVTREFPDKNHYFD